MSDVIIPYPGNPGHTDNLATFELLEAQGWRGTDASLQISLFEYDPIWRPLDQAEIWSDMQVPGEDWLFIYQINRDVPDWQKRFDRQAFDSSKPLEKLFDWLKAEDWQQLADEHGMTLTEWRAQEFPQKIWDLTNHCGWENIFGSSHWEGFAVIDPDHEYEPETAAPDVP